MGYRVLEWEDGGVGFGSLCWSRGSQPVGRLVGVLDGSNDAKGSGPNVRCIGKE